MRSAALRLTLSRQRVIYSRFVSTRATTNIQDVSSNNEEPSSNNVSLVLALLAGGSLGVAAYVYRDDPINPLKHWIGSGESETSIDQLIPPKAKEQSTKKTISASVSIDEANGKEKETRSISVKEKNHTALVSTHKPLETINTKKTESSIAPNTDELATVLSARVIALKLKDDEEVSKKAKSVVILPSVSLSNSFLTTPPPPSSSSQTLIEKTNSVSEKPVQYTVEMPPALSAMLASHKQVTENLREILKEVDLGLAARVDDLNETQLKARVVRLADELRDRARLEAVRTAEFLERNERLWLSKLNELVSSSEASFSKRTEEAEKRLRDELYKEHKERLDAETKIIASSYEEETNSKMRELKKAADAATAAHTQERLEKLKTLEAKVHAHESLLVSRSSFEEASTHVHRVELAVSVLAHALERSGPVTHEVAALQVIGETDPILKHGITAFPREIHSKRGVPTRYELQAQFSTVLKEARRSALTPEAVNEVSGFLGKAFGQSVASVALPATQAVIYARDTAYDAARFVNDFATESSKSFFEFAHPVVSLVNGALEATGLKKEGAIVPITPPTLPTATIPQPSEAVQNAASTAIHAISSAAAAAAAGASDINRVGSIFDKAEAAVAGGDLNGALNALAALDGQKGGSALAEWSHDARTRIQTDAALRVIKARAGLLSASLY